MKSSLRTVLLGGSALAAIAALGLAPAAQAGAASGEVVVGSNFGEASPCIISGDTPSIAPVSLPVPSGSASNSGSRTATSSNGATEGDTVALALSGEIAVTVPEIDNRRAVLTGRAASSASAMPALAETDCRPIVESYSYASVILDLPHPMWITTSVNGSGSGTSQVMLSQGEGLTAVDLTMARGSASLAGRVEAGIAHLALGVNVEAGIGNGRIPTSRHSGTFSIEFRPMGDSSALAGTGRAYATLGARSCSSHKVAGALTAKASRARRVSVALNGTTVQTYRGTSLRARSFTVPVASTKKASVVVTTVLRDGRVLRTARSYLPCS